MQNTSSKRKISSFPRDTLEQADVVKRGWDQVGERLFVPNLTISDFLDKLKEAQRFIDRAEELKQARARAIEERNICLSELWDLTKRVRNAAKATFGDNSDELRSLLNFSENGSNGLNGHS